MSRSTQSASRDSGQALPPYLRVADHVRQLLPAGKLKAGDPLPSELELARKLDVSHMTVRKGLAVLVREGLIVRHTGKGTFVSDGSPPESPLAPTAIPGPLATASAASSTSAPLASAPADAAAVANAVPAPPARNAATHYVIALATYESHRTMPFLGYGLQGARRVFDQQHCELNIFTLSPEGLDAGLIRLLQQSGVDGLLIQGHTPRGSMARLREAGIPVVKIGIGDPAEPVPHVWFDEADLYEQLIAEACRFGHRRVALAYWGPDDAPTRPRVEACFRAAGSRCGLAATAMSLVALPPVAGASDPIDAGPILALHPVPTCLIVNDEVMALGVMADLESRGLRVPDDLSVVSLLDGAPHAHRVPLTAPDSNTETAEIYHAASELLLAYVEGRQHEPVELLHRSRIHFKASLGPAPGWRAPMSAPGSILPGSASHP